MDFYVISIGGVNWGVALAALEAAIEILESRLAVTRRLLSIAGERLQATLIHRLLIAITESVDHALQDRAASGFDRIGLNLDHLLTIARLAGTVTVSARSKGDPARLVGDDPDALWIVMPMRL
ncbi:hypothetical protein P2H44_20035 [Albimonas sp. CAU 1670]|uniref:hypothetical protein n=1 Tax=Albimonas sp. CAU 1670 TaxID=3032599 RepID=UPI0023DC536A|nr:hypothetical protein [Albimonas sp. CAU 1670]MDF2234857.1 hypothetical protein [Albimonas sp. CAU 1670]